jgi:hypothetical protein
LTINGVCGFVLKAPFLFPSNFSERYRHEEFRKSRPNSVVLSTGDKAC